MVGPAKIWLIHCFITMQYLGVFTSFLARMYDLTKIYGRLFRDYWNRGVTDH